MSDYEREMLATVCRWVLEENRKDIVWTPATANAVRDIILRADAAERCAKQMLDLWPAEYWGTVLPIVDDFPFLEAAEARRGE